jgi:hypothetical protein
MGTLLRLDASKDYDANNTTIGFFRHCLVDTFIELIVIVPRIQFFAIEIARNREGLNNSFGPNRGTLESSLVNPCLLND